MDAAEVVGNPLLIAGVASVTVTYVLAVAWMSYSIRRVTPELLQVQVFHKLKSLQDSVLFMGLGLSVGMVLVTLFLANLDLPGFGWASLGALAAGVFWYGTVQYSRVFHVPRGPIRRA